MSEQGVLVGAASGRWVLGVCAGLVALVVAAFWPAFNALYVSWDDMQNFVDNQMWWGLSGENVRWMLTNRLLGHYTPLTWLSFGLQYELWGGAPGVSHAVNIAMHAVNAVLFFFVSRRVLGMLGGIGGEVRVGAGESAGAAREYSKLVTLAAWLSAAFFAVHPLRVESVAWVTERRDVLSTTFLLAGLLAYFRAVAVGSARVRDWKWYWGAVVLVFLSCASKAWGMSFFVVLIALDMYPLRRVAGVRGWFTRDGLRVVAEKVPFMVIGVVTAVVASRAVREVLAAKTLEDWSVGDRFVQACYGLMFYVKQTVAPAVHSPLYELPAELNPWEGRFLAAYVVVAAMVAAAVWGWVSGRARGVAVALFIYLVQVSPVLGVLQSGDQMVADRYSYLATMPFALMLGYGAVQLVRRAELRGGGEAGLKAARLAGFVGACVTAGLVAASYAQTTVWKDSKSLWSYAAQVTPTYRVLGYYAVTVQSSDPDLAIELYKGAVEANPKDGRSWYAMANLLRDRGDVREAEKAYLAAAETMAQPYVARQNLAIMYFGQGRREEGMRQIEMAVASVEDPRVPIKDGGPYMVYALALIDAGRKEEAAAVLRKALAYEEVRGAAGAKLRELGED
ncbi:MAG TPA: tetratricopeptide repeat protein [Phycisphaerales bacterium]|nr:tetratricopeptide repeat protein [Phycisphaerales bacterium]